jgi:hypothetical protein
MTSNDVTWIAPPTLGEVLYDTTSYQTWAIGMPVDVRVSARHVRRPRRGVRKLASVAAVVAAAGVAVVGWAGGARAATVAYGAAVSVHSGTAVVQLDSGLSFRVVGK